MAFDLITVCVFGRTDQEWLGRVRTEDTSGKGAEATDFDLHAFADDTNLDTILARVRPHVLLTFGARQEDFPRLFRAPLEIRRRWLHFGDMGVAPQTVAEGIMSTFVTNATTIRFPDHPLVSVFTPTYMPGEKFQRPLRSLLAQTYTNWEWVVVDDSPDGGKTFAEVAELAQRDPRVRVFRPDLPCGIIGEVKRRACGLARGEILVELDHDDELTKECLAHLVAAFHHYPEAGFAYTDCAEVSDTGENLGYPEGWGFGFGSYRMEMYEGRLYKVTNYPGLNSKTLRHIVGVPNHVRAWSRVAYYLAGGHSPEIHVCDDYELLLRTFLTTRMIHVRKFGYIQYITASGSNTQRTRNKEIQRLVRYFRASYEAKIHERLEELGLDDFMWRDGVVDWRVPNPPRVVGAELVYPPEASGVQMTEPQPLSDSGQQLAFYVSPHALHSLVGRVGSSDSLSFQQIFTDREYSCLDDLTDPGLILDCGAYVGYSSAWFLSRFPDCHVIAIEPDPGNFALLQRNVAPFGGRIQTLAAAVWSHPAALKLSEVPYRRGLAWARQVRECRPGEGADLPSTDIGTLLRESGYTSISVLKVDIEAAEKIVFGSNYESWLGSVENIVIELHDQECSDTFHRALAGQGFQISHCGELTVCKRTPASRGNSSAESIRAAVVNESPESSGGSKDMAAKYEVGQKVLFANQQSTVLALKEENGQFKYYVETGEVRLPMWIPEASMKTGQPGPATVFFNRSTPHLLVVDNFYKDPDQVRAFALEQEFAPNLKNYKGKRTRERFLWPHLREEFERLLGRSTVDWLQQPANGTFQITGFDDPLVWHSDLQSYAAAVYLTPDAPIGAGTSFLRDTKYHCRRPPHHPLEFDRFPDEASRVAATKETYNEYNYVHPDIWELVDKVGGVYNRLVLWDAQLIHSASSYEGLKSELADKARLVQLFFFTIG